MFLPHPRVKVSIVGNLRDREVACSASDRQGSNFESCVWRTASSPSSHHPQEVLLAQFSLYVHKGGLKPDSFHFISEVENTSKLAIYSTFEREFEPERYLNFKIIKSHRQALSRLSCSSHMLQIQTGRHKNMLIADWWCVFCKELDIIVLKDEYNFSMLCPAYTDLRSNYLFIHNISYSNFIGILTETDENKIKKLASFVYHAEKLRSINLTNMYWFVLHKGVL